MFKNILSKKCLVCSEIFFKPINCSLNNWNNRKKFCSKDCHNKSKIGKEPWNKYTKGIMKSNSGSFQKGRKETFGINQKRRKSLMGRKVSEETKRKLSLANRDEKAQNWKGNKATYSSIHKWFRRRYGKAYKCENKNCSYLYSKSFDWANLNHQYNRDKREDWLMMCRGCHIRYDKEHFAAN